MAPAPATSEETQAAILRHSVCCLTGFKCTVSQQFHTKMAKVIAPGQVMEKSVCVCNVPGGLKCVCLSYITADALSAHRHKNSLYFCP